MDQLIPHIFLDDIKKNLFLNIQNYLDFQIEVSCYLYNQNARVYLLQTSFVGLKGLSLNQKILLVDANPAVWFNLHNEILCFCLYEPMPIQESKT